MTVGLENMLSSRREHFKSEGERKIAYFLDDNSIRYQYEPGVLVNSSYDKTRIWYPDFYLPAFASYIEYFGMVGKESYDEGIKTKLSTYQQMGMDVISIYPWTFSGDWQQYIMSELEKTTLRRYNVDTMISSQKNTGLSKGLFLIKAKKRNLLMVEICLSCIEYCTTII